MDSKKLEYPTKIVIIFLIYGNDYLLSGKKEIKKIVQRMFSKISMEWIVVDNQHINEPYKIGEMEVIAGDNTYYEFSGWDTGYQYAIKNHTIDDETIFLFVNDTFHRRNYADGKNFLDIFDKSILADRDILNSVIGYLDDFPRDVVLDGIVYRQWIRSNIFFLPAKIVRKLYPLTFPFSKERIFSSNNDTFWHTSDLLISENWKAYINSWLFGEENPNYPEYSLHWLKAEPLSKDNRDFFERKVITILSEHYLTARLLRDGINIIDTNIFDKDPQRHIKPYYQNEEA